MKPAIQPSALQHFSQATKQLLTYVAHICFGEKKKEDITSSEGCPSQVKLEERVAEALSQGKERQEKFAEQQQSQEGYELQEQIEQIYQAQKSAKQRQRNEVFKIFINNHKNPIIHFCQNLSGRRMNKLNHALESLDDPDSIDIIKSYIVRAFSCAEEHLLIEMIKILPDANISPDTKQQSNIGTPLHFIAKRDPMVSSATLEALLNVREDIRLDIPDYQGLTANDLIKGIINFDNTYSINYFREKIINFCQNSHHIGDLNSAFDSLDNPHSIDIIKSQIVKAFAYAEQHLLTDMIDILPDVNICPKAKHEHNIGTPLHFLLKNPNLNYDIVYYLLYKGASVNIKDRNGMTPLDLAKDKAWIGDDVVMILHQYKCLEEEWMEHTEPSSHQEKLLLANNQTALGRWW